MAACALRSIAQNLNYRHNQTFLKEKSLHLLHPDMRLQDRSSNFHVNKNIQISKCSSRNTKTHTFGSTEFTTVISSSVRCPSPLSLINPK